MAVKEIKERKSSKRKLPKTLNSEIVKKNKNRVWVRKRIKTPFPTNYLPTVSLKMSSILRYYEYKSLRKQAEREQRRERDILSSQYSILVTYLEEEIEKEREKLIQGEPEAKPILLFKIDAKFDGVLGKVIKYLSMQDEVKVVSINNNYEKITSNITRLIIVKIRRN